MKLLNTINETARLCRENDIGISRNHIRYLANNGLVPSVRIGNKILINWDKLLFYLNNNTLSNNPDKEHGIQKICS